MRKIIIAILLLSYLFTSLVGCDTSSTERSVIDSIKSYRDIPGVTEDEIFAIEALKNGRESFSYGQILQTESFMLSDGTNVGFTTYLCELFSELFGIEFKQELYDEWGGMKAGLDAHTLDFIGDVTQADEQESTYFMTRHFMERPLKIFTYGEPDVFMTETDVNGRKLGFLEGSVTATSILESYPLLSFEAIEVKSYDVAAEKLRSGELDMFVMDGVMELVFEKYDYIQSKEFFTLVFTPVSLTTANPELVPVIAVMDKYLDAGGLDKVHDLYRQGKEDYARYRLNKSFTVEERAYLNALAEQGTAVNVGLEHDNYPTSFYNESEKEFQGMALDILTEISRLTDIKFEHTTTKDITWAKLLEKLKTGEISIVSHLLYSDERKEDFIWSDPYDSAYCILISTLEQPILETYQVPLKTVGMLSGSAFEDVYKEWFRGENNTISYGTQNEGLDALEKGEVDLYMSYEYTLLSQLNFREKTGFKANIRFDALFDSMFGFNKNDELLRSIINKSLPYVNTDAIASEWRNRTFDYNRMVSDMRTKYLAIFSIVLFCALIAEMVLFFKNKKLSRGLETTVQERTRELMTSRAALEQVLNSIDAFIYVSELDTCKILFVNKKMEENYGIHNAKGKICWKVFQDGMTGPCDFCPIYTLKDENSPPVIWEELSTVTGKYTQNIDRMIRWTDDKLVHIQHSVDITDLKETERSLQDTMEELAVYNDMLMILQSKLDTAEAINTAAGKLKDICGCGKVTVMQKVNDTGRLYRRIVSCPESHGGEWENNETIDELIRKSELISLCHPDVADIAPGIHTVYVLGLSGQSGIIVLEYIEKDKMLTEKDRKLLLYSATLFESLIIRRSIEDERADFAERLEREVLERTEDLRLMTLKADEAREKLALQTATLTTIYEAIPDMIFCMDTDMRYTSCNLSFAQFAGMPENELIGKHAEEVFCRDLEMADRYIAENKDVLENKRLNVIERPITYPDGMQRIIEMVKTPLFQKNKLTGIMGIARDITERKAIEEAAYNASKAKSLFLANMSHEIRTPMNAIIGMSELLLNEKLDGRKHQYVADIHKSAKSLLGIINDILDLSKIDEGKLKLVPVDSDLSVLLKNVISMISFSSLAKGLDFIDDTRIEPREYVRIDETRVNQILLNLLSNAIKFTEAGHVRLAAEIADGNIVFEVSDTGMGIKQEELPAIFVAFEQADVHRNRAIKGTGLGLSITKRLVEMMDGCIWVESDYGVGTVFHVTIPYVQGEQPVAQAADADSAILKAPMAQVLLVDDIQTNLTVGAGLMRLHGITADLALSGRKAMELIALKDYDMVFMDHMMPEEDGVEVTKKIRSLGGKYAELPIIALTANALNEARELLLNSGMNDFLSKPINRFELNSILRKWLPAHRLEQSSGSAEATQSESCSEILERAMRIEGMDIGLALSRLGGLQDVLEESIRQTAYSISERIGNMDGFLSGSELESFAISAHGFKSSLANIGAMELSVFAAELEIAAGAGDFRMCAEKFAVFASVMEGFAVELKAVFPESNQKEKIKELGDGGLLTRKLEETVTCLRTFETDEALACMDELACFTYGDATDKLLCEAKDATEAYEYNMAIRILEGILSA